MKKYIAAMLVACLIALSGCGQMTQMDSNANQNGGTNQNGNANQNGNTNQNGGTNQNEPPTTPEVDFDDAAEDMFSKRDRETGYDPDEAVRVTLNGTTATATGDGVQIDGGRVTLTGDADYIISGTLTSGMLVVNADENAKPHLIFDGVQITNPTGAAFYILEADKVVVTLAKDTQNSLQNGGSFVAIDQNNIDGAVFSKQDLTFNGKGALTVISPAGHGIVCKDDLVLTGGTYTVNAADHGLDANDSVRLTAAALTIDAGKDAVHVENEDNAEKGFVFMDGGSITGEAEGDGISASAYLHIVDGTVDLLVGGGAENGNKTHSDHFGDFMGGGGPQRPGRPRAVVPAATTQESTSMKGLKATGSVCISGGNITINAADDALHSNATLLIEGGTLTLATGDDGVHADGQLTVSGGNITVTESYEGIEAKHVLIEGGTVTLKASDDGINAAGGADQSGTEGGRDGMFGGGRPMGANSNGSIRITGGTVTVQASGDGMDANGTLEIGGGKVTVAGPTQGDTATLDFDVSGVISGGTFIGTGAAGGMAQTFSNSSQGVIAVKMGTQAAGTQITLQNAAGETLISYQPPLGFALVILSCPAMQKGETYTLTVGEQTSSFAAA